ncbi:MAG: hypothetical protein IJ077_05155 [Eubacterium sp.]|nr:hypothetical protein [Eubacterium sp.]MBR1531005.1 hypothetical protein [Eubacterium sp.]
MANPILSKNSNNKVSSPEQLSDYIKVSNVGVWLLLGVIIIFLVSVFVWGVFGSLKNTVTTTGFCENDSIVCYVENPAGIEVGDKVKVGDKEGEVKDISKTPVSASEISKKYDEYTVYTLSPAEWNYEVSVSVKDCPDGVQSVKIITNSVKPISFIKG